MSAEAPPRGFAFSHVPSATRIRQAGEALLTALLESSSDAILVVDRRGIVVMVNARSAELFGYERPHELLGLRRSDLLSALDGEPSEESSRQCVDLRSRAHQITNRFGTIVPVEASISVISGDRGKCLAKVIAVRDVAAYRRLEVEHRVIFESAGDGMVVYTLEGEIVAANQAFCEMNGYACEELIGRNVAMLVHPDYHKLLGQFIETTGRGGSLRARAVNVRKDGTSFPVDVHGTIYEEEGGLRILGVARDVSEEVRAYELLEERVAERTRELELVLEVSQNVASVLELEPLLNLILEQLKTVTAFHWGAILGLEDNRLVRLAGWGDGAPEAGAYGWDLAEPELAALWQQLGRGEHAVANDLADEGLLARIRRHLLACHPQLATTAGSRSWLVVPLVFGGRTIGVLSLLHAEPGFYNDHQVRLVRAIADQAAVAIENARLYEQSQGAAALEERQRLARELHDAVTQTLFSASVNVGRKGEQWSAETVNTGTRS